MLEVDQRKALETRLKLGWVTTPIKWEEISFDPPVDATNKPLPYIAFVLRNGSSEDIALGSDNPWQRYAGVVMVHIFTPELTGIGLATQYGTLIKNIYLRAPRQIMLPNDAIIRLFPPHVNNVGTLAGYRQTNVIVPFKMDAHPE